MSVFARHMVSILLVTGLLGLGILIQHDARATGPYFFTSEGCDGYGFTDALNPPPGVSSETLAQVSGTSTPCNWTYVLGNYQDTGGNWYYGLGPGWVQSGYVRNAYSDAQAANTVGHSACNPGGTCPNVAYTWTSYP